MSIHEQMKETDYVTVHNLIYGAIEFAEEAGILPDKSFELTRYILSPDTEDIPLMQFDFGKDGRHLLIANNRVELDYYLPKLKKSLGDNFRYICNMPEDISDFDLLTLHCYPSNYNGAQTSKNVWEAQDVAGWGGALRFRKISLPSQFVFLADGRLKSRRLHRNKLTSSLDNSETWGASPWLSHRDAVNVLWGDGHAAAADRGEFISNYNKWGVTFLPR